MNKSMQSAPFGAQPLTLKYLRISQESGNCSVIPDLWNFRALSHRAHLCASALPPPPSPSSSFRNTPQLSPRSLLLPSAVKQRAPPETTATLIRGVLEGGRPGISGPKASWEKMWGCRRGRTPGDWFFLQVLCAPGCPGAHAERTIRIEALLTSTPAATSPARPDPTRLRGRAGGAFWPRLHPASSWKVSAVSRGGCRAGKHNTRQLLITSAELRLLENRLCMREADDSTERESHSHCVPDV